MEVFSLYPENEILLSRFVLIPTRAICGLVGKAKGYGIVPGEQCIAPCLKLLEDALLDQQTIGISHKGQTGDLRRKGLEDMITPGVRHGSFSGNPGGPSARQRCGQLVPLGHIRYEQRRQFRLHLCQVREVLTPGSFLLGQLRQAMMPYGLQSDLFYRALACRKGIRAFLTETRQACPMRLHKHIIMGFAMNFGSFSELYKGSLRWLTVQIPTYFRRACE